MRRTKTSQFGSFSPFGSTAVNTNPAALSTPLLMADPENPEAIGWFGGYSGQSFTGQPYAGGYPRSGYVGEEDDVRDLMNAAKRLHRGWHRDEEHSGAVALPRLSRAPVNTQKATESYFNKTTRRMTSHGESPAGRAADALESTVRGSSIPGLIGVSWFYQYDAKGLFQGAGVLVRHREAPKGAVQLDQRADPVWKWMPEQLGQTARGIAQNFKVKVVAANLTPAGISGSAFFFSSTMLSAVAGLQETVGTMSRSLHKYGTANISNPAFLNAPQAFFGGDLGDPHDVSYGVTVGVGQLAMSEMMEDRFADRHDGNPLKVGTYGARVTEDLLYDIRDRFPNMNYGAASTLEYIHDHSGVGLMPDLSVGDVEKADTFYGDTPKADAGGPPAAVITSVTYSVRQAKIDRRAVKDQLKENRALREGSRDAMREAWKEDRKGDRAALKALNAGPGKNEYKLVSQRRADRMAMREARAIDREGDEAAEDILNSSGVVVGNMDAVGVSYNFGNQRILSSLSRGGYSPDFDDEAGLFGSKKRKAKREAMLQQAQENSGALFVGNIFEPEVGAKKRGKPRTKLAKLKSKLVKIADQITALADEE